MLKRMEEVPRYRARCAYCLRSMPRVTLRAHDDMCFTEHPAGFGPSRALCHGAYLTNASFRRDVRSGNGRVLLTFQPCQGGLPKANPQQLKANTVDAVMIVSTEEQVELQSNDIGCTRGQRLLGTLYARTSCCHISCMGQAKLEVFTLHFCLAVKLVWALSFMPTLPETQTFKVNCKSGHRTCNYETWITRSSSV